MVVRMRATRGHTGNRRSHHALDDMRLSKCPSCSSMVMRHRVCENCGKYRGRVVIDVAAKTAKTLAKQKAREKAASAK